jgi:uncharacterized repeat protein (TIGR01451 family)
LQVNGDAAADAAPVGPEAAPVLRLTRPVTDQAGSAFSKHTIQLGSNASFSTAFAFRMGDGGGSSDGTTNPLGADGIVFVLNTVANNVGGIGGGAGYSGIDNSVGIKFDTWADNVANAQDNDPNGNFVAVYLNGSVQTAGYSPYSPRNPSTESQYYSPPTSMKNGDIWYAWIDYNGQTDELDVRLSDSVDARPANPQLSQTLNLSDPSILGSSPAVYAGFTSGTGGAWDNNDILSWQLNNAYQPIRQVGAPSITQQPVSVITNQGVNVTFTVGAVGSPPLSYHWQFNGTNLADNGRVVGSLSNSLSIFNVQEGDAGGYSVLVNNPLGSVTSSVATLTVLLPPTITQQPLSVITNQGATVQFSVVASGNPPPSYQWVFYQTNMLAGATNATLTLTNVQPTDEGDYSVVVSNIAGATNSATASLVVLVPPVITQQPLSVITNQGANVAFTVGARGSAPLSYQWQFNGSALPGATNTMLTLSNVRTNQDGSYLVIVSNAAGETPSAAATLTVLGPPSVWLIQPTNGASFQTGANVPIEAIASSPGGTVTQVQFFQGGTSLLGVATSAPHSIVWSNVPAGTYSLTAVAVGSGGSSPPSSAVVIYVTNPAPPLSVTLVSPTNYSGFCPGMDIPISAVASNFTGTATVQFFAGDSPLGTAAASPYPVTSYTWSAPPTGDYWLTARITDAQGHSAVSPAVVVTVSSYCLGIAIIRPSPDPEIDLMRGYLFQMGYGSQVFDPSEVNPQVLSSFQAVIWDDLGQEAALQPGTVDALASAYYSNSIPLYLIGERLASAATNSNLSGAQSTTWMALTHLGLADGQAGGETVSVGSPDPLDPILNGIYGTVTNFAYADAIDLATNADGSVDVLGTLGGADVLLRYPPLESSETGTRLFTQQARLMPPKSPGSTNQLQALFENTVFWLLGARCVDVAVSLTPTNQPDSAQVGQLLEYNLVVYSGGECPGTGVFVTNVLPPGVQFFSAYSEQGSKGGYDPVAGEVSFFPGLVSTDPVVLTITVVPVQAGSITNVVGLQVNGQNLSSESVVTFVTEVSGGVPTPSLSIARMGPNEYDLQLSGMANVTYEVLSSEDLRTWTSVTNVLGPAWQMLCAPVGGGNPQSLFYRAKVAQ